MTTVAMKTSYSLLWRQATIVVSTGAFQPRCFLQPHCFLGKYYVAQLGNIKNKLSIRPLSSKLTIEYEYSQDNLDNRANQMNPNNNEYSGDDDDDESAHKYSPDELNHHADQINRNNDEYRGDDDDDESAYEYSQDDLDNHANQMSPNNDEYGHSRGW